jgi:RNA polymerase sigma-70 factor (ECF subfamily)
MLDQSWQCAIEIAGFQLQSADFDDKSRIGMRILGSWSKLPEGDHNRRILNKSRASRSEPKKFRMFFGIVSGFDRFRGYTSGARFVSDDCRQIGLGGTDDQFLGELIDRYREMMFRTARAITYNDYDADDVIQRLCVRFVIGGIPAGLRENPPAYLTAAIVNEAKNIHRTRQRRRIDQDIDPLNLSAPARSPTEQALLDALQEAKACLTPEEKEMVDMFYTHGLSQADIAEIKEMEEDTVAQKLSRSRKKIKKAMEVEGRIRP